MKVHSTLIPDIFLFIIRNGHKFSKTANEFKIKIKYLIITILIKILGDSGNSDLGF